MAKKKKPADERPDITINVDGTADWMLNMHGPIKGLYTGLFKFRCAITPMQKIAANKEYREMLGDNPTFADQHVTFMAFALTQLKQLIISSPPFWTATTSGFPGDIEDDVVLQEVLEAAVQAQLKYKAVLEERKLQALEQAKAAAEAILKQKKQDKENEIK